VAGLGERENRDFLTTLMGNANPCYTRPPI
jgi:hypothetical protein